MHTQLKELLRWIYAIESAVPTVIPFVSLKKEHGVKNLQIDQCMSSMNLLEIDKFLQETNDKNYYWGTCMVGSCTGKMGRHCEKDVLYVPTLWTDIDNCDELELNRRMHEAEGIPEPSLIVKTGNGFHLYWKLITPITPERNGYTFKKTKEVLKEISRRMGGEGADFARILRVPTTRYIKTDEDMKEPKYIEIFQWNKELLYKWSDFEGLSRPVVEHKEVQKRQDIDIPHKFKRDHPIELIPGLYGIVPSSKIEGDTHRYYCPSCQPDNAGRGSLLIYVADQRWFCGNTKHEPGNNHGDVIALIQLITGKSFKDVIKVDVGGPVTRAAASEKIEQPYVRPKITVPGLGRSLSTFVHELAEHIKNSNFFVLNHELVYYKFDDKTGHTVCKSVNGTMFRTLIEKYVNVVTTCVNGETKQKFDSPRSLKADEATAIVSSPQFLDGLRVIKRVNNCRAPIMRKNGNIELLPEGYDEESKTMTISTVDFSEDMEIETACKIIDRLFDNCNFDNRYQRDRSKAVAVSAMLTLFAPTLLPEHSLRPCFIVEANASGAGKSILISLIAIPTIGYAAATTIPKTSEEMHKVLITTLRAGKQALFLDNVKGRIDCDALEAFISAPFYSGRLLGGNVTFNGQNDTTVFISVNNAHVTPDLDRRSLFINLHMKNQRAVDQDFGGRKIEHQKLVDSRPIILAALWSLVKYWDENGRKPGSVKNSAFTSWASIIAGIVETAGFGAPATPRISDISAEPDGDDMLRVKEHIVANEPAGQPYEYEFHEFCKLCREVGAFEYILGTSEAFMTQKDRSKFGWLLKRFQDREVGGLTFKMTGYGPTKRYTFKHFED